MEKQIDEEDKSLVTSFINFAEKLSTRENYQDN